MDFEVSIIRLYNRYSIFIRAKGFIGHGAEVDYADAFAMAMEDWQKKSATDLDSVVTLG